MLLSKLYQNIRCKDKILLQKRFVRFEQANNGVRVITQDGGTYEGDIVVGADGMHSAVRKQMHCLANSSSPGYFEKDEYASKSSLSSDCNCAPADTLSFDCEGVPCAYKCIWGISHSMKSIKSGSIHIIMGKDCSYLLLTSPEKLYWFLFVKNSRVEYGKDVPRTFGVEEEQRLAEQHFGDWLSDHETFGDAYRNKIISSLTPLHEYQWKRWHFGRIMTIGDACHKVSCLPPCQMSSLLKYLDAFSACLWNCADCRYFSFIHLEAAVAAPQSRMELCL